MIKLLERVLESIIRHQADIENMQFGFMPGRSTTEAIISCDKTQEKHLSRKKKIYFAFVDLEKAFDRVPRSVLWWTMRKVGINECVIKLVNILYDGANSCVRIKGWFSEKFKVTIIQNNYTSGWKCWMIRIETRCFFGRMMGCFDNYCQSLQTEW